MTSKESIMRVQLDAESKERLDSLCGRRGMTQIALMSRLVQWFCSQDDFIQTSVLQTLSATSLATLAKSLMKKPASERSDGHVSVAKR